MNNRSVTRMRPNKSYLSTWTFRIFSPPSSIPDRFSGRARFFGAWLLLDGDRQLALFIAALLQIARRLRLSALILVLLSPFLFLEGRAFPQDYHLPGTAAGREQLSGDLPGLLLSDGRNVRPSPRLATGCGGRRRRWPSATTEVFDVAQHLGFPPRGSGTEAAVTRFPGNQIFQVEFVELHLRLPHIPRPGKVYRCCI